MILLSLIIIFERILKKEIKTGLKNDLEYPNRLVLFTQVTFTVNILIYIIYLSETE